jgi:hypothetical protein
MENCFGSIRSGYSCGVSAISKPVVKSAGRMIAGEAIRLQPRASRRVRGRAHDQQKTRTSFSRTLSICRVSSGQG